MRDRNSIQGLSLAKDDFLESIVANRPPKPFIRRKAKPENASAEYLQRKYDSKLNRCEKCFTQKSSTGVCLCDD